VPCGPAEARALRAEAPAYLPSPRRNTDGRGTFGAGSSRAMQSWARAIRGTSSRGPHTDRAMLPAGAEHAVQLGQGLARVGKDEQAEADQRGIETPVGKGQVFGVAGGGEEVGQAFGRSARRSPSASMPSAMSLASTQPSGKTRRAASRARRPGPAARSSTCSPGR
jgi:hypothetical protein